MSDRTTDELLDEYDRYLAASPNLPDHARLVLAERIITQIKRTDNDHRATLRAAYDTAKRAERAELTVSAIRGEYARFLTHHDTYELTRAIGQILNGPDDSQQIRYEMTADEQIDMLPESERRIVERPGEEDE
jgi:hypothetical protein